jgi:hypothetical protein
MLLGKLIKITNNDCVTNYQNTEQNLSRYEGTLPLYETGYDPTYNYEGKYGIIVRIHDISNFMIVNLLNENKSVSIDYSAYEDDSPFEFVSPFAIGDKVRLERNASMLIESVQNQSGYGRPMIPLSGVYSDHTTVVNKEGIVTHIWWSEGNNVPYCTVQCAGRYYFLNINSGHIMKLPKYSRGHRLKVRRDLRADDYEFEGINGVLLDNTMSFAERMLSTRGCYVTISDVIVSLDKFIYKIEENRCNYVEEFFVPNYAIPEPVQPARSFAIGQKVKMPDVVHSATTDALNRGYDYMIVSSISASGDITSIKSPFAISMSARTDTLEPYEEDIQAGDYVRILRGFRDYAVVDGVPLMPMMKYMNKMKVTSADNNLVTVVNNDSTYKKAMFEHVPIVKAGVSINGFTPLMYNIQGELEVGKRIKSSSSTTHEWRGFTGRVIKTEIDCASGIYAAKEGFDESGWYIICTAKPVRTPRGDMWRTFYVALSPDEYASYKQGYDALFESERTSLWQSHRIAVTRRQEQEEMMRRTEEIERRRREERERLENQRHEQEERQRTEALRMGVFKHHTLGIGGI